MRAVIPCLNYADYLATTLPAWCAVLGAENVTVTTSPRDQATLDVARRFGCVLCVTEGWHQGAINKARGLDAAFRFGNVPDATHFEMSGVGIPLPAPPRFGEICLSIDADIYPRLPTTSVTCAMRGDGLQQRALRREFATRIANLRPNVLYGIDRYQCGSPSELEQMTNVDKPLRRERRLMCATGLPYPRVGLEGYFQAWRCRSGDSFGSYPTCATYDLVFGSSFTVRRRIQWLDAIHLGVPSTDWDGRRSREWGKPSARGSSPSEPVRRRTVRPAPPQPFRR